ncbi:MAG: DinB family protein [Acidobacteriota bacterium]
MRCFRIAIVSMLVVAPLFGRGAKPQQNELPLVAPRPAGPRSGFRAELLADLDGIQKKYLDLADAIPARKYSWRPSEGVRSISEVYMHVAGSNYLLATFVGVKPPADIPKDFERITAKQRVIAELQRSFEHLRGVILATGDADLDKPVRLYGEPASERQVLMTIENHLHEHLGQSIAYARMNGIVPPWSRKES